MVGHVNLLGGDLSRSWVLYALFDDEHQALNLHLDLGLGVHRQREFCVCKARS